MRSTRSGPVRRRRPRIEILREHVAPDPPWIEYLGLEDAALDLVIGLVNRYGEEFDPVPWSAWEDRFERGKPDCCHHNARRLAEAYPGLRYVEGFAGDYFSEGWYVHAWCVNYEGAVIDPTWRDRADFYFGVVLDVETVRRLQGPDAENNAFLVVTRPWLHRAIRTASKASEVASEVTVSPFS